MGLFKSITKAVTNPVGFVKDTVKGGVELVKDTANAGVDIVKDTAKAGVSIANNTIKTVGNVAEVAVDVVDTILEEVVNPVAETVVNTINYALENPVDAAIMVVAASGPWAPWAVPAASAAITVSHGGSLEDGVKAAAVAFATQQFMTQTDIGKSISAYTNTTGAEAGAASGAEASTAAIVSKGVTSSLNGAIVGGMKSVLTGQDIGKGISQGAIAGGVYGSTDQYFQNLYKEGSLDFTDDPKLNAKIAKSMGAASGAALGAALTNKDPVTAVGNYLAYKMMDVANTEFAKAAKGAYKSMADSFSSVESSEKTAIERQNSYNKQFADLDKRSEDYNTSVTDYQNKIKTDWTPVQEKLDAEKSNYADSLAKYKEQETIYNDTTKSVGARNAAAKQMEIYAQKTADASKAYDAVFDANKNLYNELNASGEALKSTKTTLDSDFASLQNNEGKLLTEAKAEFDKNAADYNEKKAAAEAADQEYQNQIAEVVTREIAIDSINNGLVAPTKTNEDGSVTFENGITLKTDGTMYQGDQQLFTSAEGIKQNELRFANEQGKNIWFDDTANRLASDTDVQDVYKNNYGLDVTPEEALKFAGKTYDQADNEEVKDFAIDKISSEFEKYGYKAPDEETIASYIDKGGNTLAKADAAIDPYYVEEQEAKEFVRSTLGREATPEEIAMLAGTKLESETLGTKSAEEARMYETLTNLFGAADKSGYLSGEQPSFDVAAWDGFNLGQERKDPLGLTSDQKQMIADYLREYSGEKGSGIEAQDDGTFAVKDPNNAREVRFSADGTYLGTANVITGTSTHDPAPTSELALALLSGVDPLIAKLPPPTDDSQIAQLFGSDLTPEQMVGNYSALFGQVGSGSGAAGGAGTTNEGLWNSNIAIKREAAGSGADASDQPLYTLYGADRPNIILWQELAATDPNIKIQATPDGRVQITSKDPSKPITQQQVDKLAKAASGATGVSIATDSKIPSSSSLDEAMRAEYLSDFIKSMTNTGSPAASTGAKPTLVDFPTTGQSGTTGTTTTTGGTPTGGSGTNTGANTSGAGAAPGSGTANTTGGNGTAPGTGTGTTGTGTGSAKTGTGTGAGTSGSGTGGGFGDLSSYMTGALALGSGFGSGTAPTPLTPSLLTSKDPGTKFEGALSQFQEFASRPFYDENTYADQFAQPQPTPQEEPEFMNTPYYNYGELDNIEDILNPQTDEQPTQFAAQGGLMATPLMAAGGMTGTRHGQYAHGGLSTPVVHHSGKARVDFRHGDAVTGAGDGQSDDIPAMLADGEFVFPADVVAAIGNGSTKAGSDKLYDMMHGIRSHVRSAKPKDLPPEIKSPLDFLKTKPKKARR